MLLFRQHGSSRRKGQGCALLPALLHDSPHKPSWGDAVGKGGRTCGLALQAPGSRREGGDMMPRTLGALVELDYRHQGWIGVALLSSQPLGAVLPWSRVTSPLTIPTSETGRGWPSPEPAVAPRHPCTHPLRAVSANPAAHPLPAPETSPGAHAWHHLVLGRDSPGSGWPSLHWHGVAAGRRVHWAGEGHTPQMPCGVYLGKGVLARNALQRAGPRQGVKQSCTLYGVQALSAGGGSCPRQMAVSPRGTCHQAGRWQVKRILAPAHPAQSLRKDEERDQP